MFSFCLQSGLEHMWRVVRIYEPAEVRQDEISIESPHSTELWLLPQRDWKTLHFTKQLAGKRKDTKLMADGASWV